MATKVSLSEVIGELEIANDEMSSFVSERTGQIVTLSHEAMRLAEADSEEALPDCQGCAGVDRLAQAPEQIRYPRMGAHEPICSSRVCASAT
jgi:hypothetical protein